MEEHPFSFSDLHMAVLKGDVPDLLAIFENTSSVPDLDSRSRSMTALQAAGHYGNYELIPILLANGFDVNAPPGEFGCALQALISSVSYHGLGDLFWKKNVEKTTAKQNEQAAGIHSLLEAGANVNHSGGEFGSPLAAAAAFGLEEVVEVLLTRGADPNSKGGRLGTALTAACAKGGMPVEWCVSLVGPEAYGRIAARLLRAGTNVDVVGGVYGTALQAAASVGDCGVVEMLLGEGNGDPNVRGGRHGSALGAAAFAGHLDVVDALLSAGAEVGPTRYSSSKLDDWDMWREEPVSSLFLKYGAALPLARNAVSADSIRDEKIDDPMRVASVRGNSDIVKTLEEQR